MPRLCVEVVSSNRLRDRVTKRMVYGAAGVPEYWVVDPGGWVERFHGDNLDEVDVVDHGRLVSAVLPDLVVDLDDLFGVRASM